MTRDDTLFDAAAELPPAERAAYLEQACRKDPAQRARVEALLAASDRATSFLAAPLVGRSAAAPVDAAESPGQRIGRYKLLEKIGTGGCGVVWMAEQEEPVRRRVALKVIKLGMDTKEVVARFEAERQALALMDHANIAKVFDGGATELGRPYFVMELVRGVPITTYCDECRLGASERIGLLVTVCQAVQHAHQKGIIHRDLKPSNILVTVNDGVAVPKVIDFGIAKAIQGRLTDQTLFTGFQQFIGTPVYVSPEQAEMSSVDVDTRSDIYSLGVLLYELLTGGLPFDRQTLLRVGLDEMRRQIREVDPPRPSARFRTLDRALQTTVAQRRGLAPAQLATLLRGDLDWIVMRCLEKSRARRYETANGLAMDLQRYLRHEPVLARPPSPGYVLQKLIWRHRFAFGAATAVAVTLTLGVIVSTWQAVRATRAEEVARAGEREQRQLREAAQRAEANEAAQRRKAEEQELAARRRAYAADMNLLRQALVDDNHGRARLLLNQQRPRPGETDLRGWEWRYLWQFCQSDASATVAVGEGGVDSLAVSADGKWLACGSMTGGRLLLRNQQTNEESRLLLGDGVVRVVFAPDGRRIGVVTGMILSGEQDRQPPPPLWSVFRLIDLETRQTTVQWRIPGRTLNFGFSPDGERVATATQRVDGTTAVETWTVREGATLTGVSLPTGLMAAYVGRAAVAPDFSRVAQAGNLGQMHLVDLRTGEHQVIDGVAAERVSALEFSPDSRLLAVSGWAPNPVIRLFDVAAGREIAQFEGHTHRVRRMVFWPDGGTLATAGEDRTVRVWDVASRRLLRTFRGHEERVLAIALGKDGRTLLSGAAAGPILSWEFSPSAPPTPPPLRPVEGGVLGSSMRIADDSVIVMVGPVERWTEMAQGVTARDMPPRRLERWSGRHFHVRERLLEFPVGTQFSVSDDRPLVAVSRRDSSVVEVWDWEKRAPVRRLELPGETVVPGPFLPGGNRLFLIVIGSNEAARSLVEWDLSEGREVRAWSVGGLAAPRSKVTGDGRFLFSPSGDTLLRIDLQDGSWKKLDFAVRGGAVVNPAAAGARIPVPVRHGFGVYNLETERMESTIALDFDPLHRPAALSGDGNRLFIGASGYEAIGVWDLAGGNFVLTLNAPATIFTSVTVSPGGGVLMARTIYGNSYLWRTPSWAEIEAAERRRNVP